MKLAYGQRGAGRTCHNRPSWHKGQLCPPSASRVLLELRLQPEAYAGGWELVSPGGWMQTLEAFPWICSLAQRVALQTKSYWRRLHITQSMKLKRNAQRKVYGGKIHSIKEFFLFQRRITIRFSKILSKLSCCRPWCTNTDLIKSHIHLTSLNWLHSSLHFLINAIKERVGKWSLFSL